MNAARQKMEKISAWALFVLSGLICAVGVLDSLDAIFHEYPELGMMYTTYGQNMYLANAIASFVMYVAVAVGSYSLLARHKYAASMFTALLVIPVFFYAGASLTVL